jgi:hypothetical protein
LPRQVTAVETVVLNVPASPSACPRQIAHSSQQVVQVVEAGSGAGGRGRALFRGWPGRGGWYKGERHLGQPLPSGRRQALAVLEMLRKLLNDEIKARMGKNVVQTRSFEAMLTDSLRRYQNRTIDTAEVITELVAIAHEMQAARQRGEQLGLAEEELAFYDALADNESAVEVMGDKHLAFIAHELIKMLRQTVSVDWTEKQCPRAKIRVMVKRILKKHGYPSDLQEKATETVLEQAERIAADWRGA